MKTSEIAVDIWKKLIAAQFTDFGHQFFVHVAVDINTAAKEKNFNDEAFTKSQR